jgi:hypothetical protein
MKNPYQGLEDLSIYFVTSILAAVATLALLYFILVIVPWAFKEIQLKWRERE